MIQELLNVPGLTVGNVSDINDLVNEVYLNLKAQYIIAIFNPSNVGSIFALTLGNSMTNSVRSSYFGIIARYSSRAVGQGYNSFNAFKSAQGVAGSGKAWHRIVEQNKVGQFSASQIHNTKNLVVVEAGASSVHARTTGYYG